MNDQKISRKRRVRAKISGTAEVPRLSVSVSLKHIRAQVIDDSIGKTIVSASDMKIDQKNTKVQKAEKIGTEIAQKAIKAGIKKVVFDRSSKLYHGRVEALANSARAAGLEF